MTHEARESLASGNLNLPDGACFVMSREELAIAIARPEVKILAVLVVYLILALGMGLRRGWHGTPTTLLVAIPLAGLGQWVFGRSLLGTADGGKVARSWSNALAAFSGFFPFILGCYLVFYQGFWGLFRLAGGFAFGSLVWSGVAIFLGYKLVRQVWIVSEYADAVSNGRIRVEG